MDNVCVGMDHTALVKHTRVVSDDKLKVLKTFGKLQSVHRTSNNTTTINVVLLTVQYHHHKCGTFDDVYL